MESLGDMLAKRPAPQEPEEVRLLREYVQKKYNVTPKITSAEHYITMAVPNSALASTLHFEESTMIKECKVAKKLRIRIGQ